MMGYRFFKGKTIFIHALIQGGVRTGSRLPLTSIYQSFAMAELFQTHPGLVFVIAKQCRTPPPENFSWIRT